jgi:two-component system, sensor histidine kinase PdtaS
MKTRLKYCISGGFSIFIKYNLGTMKIYQCIAAVLFLTFIACENHTLENQKNEIVAELLQKAKNKRNPIDDRLHFVLQADSIAVSQKSGQQHLDCLLLIAALHLELNNIDSAWSEFANTTMLARQLHDTDGLAISISSIASIYQTKGKYDSAIQLFLEAQGIFDSLRKPEPIAQNLVNTGIAFESQGNFAEAFKVDVRAAIILDSLRDTDDYASVCLSAGNVLRQLGQFDGALQYQMQALKILTEEADSAGIALVQNNMGNSYRGKKEYKEALKNYFVALNIKKSLKSEKEIAVTLQNIGQTYLELKDYTKADDYLTQGLTMEITAKDTDGLIETSNSLAELYLKTDNIQKSIEAAERGFRLSPKGGLIQQRLINNLILFNAYSKLKKNDLAVMHAEKSFDLKDSLLNETIAKEISLLNTQFKVGQKEKQIQFHKQLEGSQKSQIRTQDWAIGLLVTLLLYVGYLAYRLRQSNKQIKMANRRVETLLSELNHRLKNNLQFIMAMLQRQAYTSGDERQAALLKGNIERIRSLSIIHTLLYKRDFSVTIEARDFLEALISNLAQIYQANSKDFVTKTKIQSMGLSIDTAIPVALIVNELVTNIYKHAAILRDGAYLGVRLEENNNHCTLVIEDNCSIWNFDESKELKKGLGLLLVDDLIIQLSGKWNVVNTTAGTTNIIEFTK